MKKIAKISSIIFVLTLMLLPITNAFSKSVDSFGGQKIASNHDGVLDPGNAGGGDPGNAGGGDPGNAGGGDPGNAGGGSDSGTISNPVLLQNPLSGIGTLPELIEKILEIITKIGVWILAGFIIYTGYMFVAARGNPAELEKAKGALKYTLIGGAILLGAWVIANAIVGTIEALK